MNSSLPHFDWLFNAYMLHNRLRKQHEELPTNIKLINSISRDISLCVVPLVINDSHGAVVLPA